MTTMTDVSVLPGETEVRTTREAELVVGGEDVGSVTEEVLDTRLIDVLTELDDW